MEISRIIRNSVLGLILGAGFMATQPALAQTPDLLTPASEDICANYGFSGRVAGLCNAYCEAMGCDSVDPQASDKACSNIMSRIENALPEGEALEFCDDQDGDGWANSIDNCPSVSNPDQELSVNWNEVGAACDLDTDGVDVTYDNCPVISNPDQDDDDGDGIGDACDNCPGISNPQQADTNGDDIGDACEDVQPQVCVAWSADDMKYITDQSPLIGSVSQGFGQIITTPPPSEGIGLIDFGPENGWRVTCATLIGQPLLCTTLDYTVNVDLFLNTTIAWISDAEAEGCITAIQEALDNLP